MPAAICVLASDKHQAAIEAMQAREAPPPARGCRVYGDQPAIELIEPPLGI
jgi:hypothetical protein